MEMADLITYAGQVAMSFEKASEMLEKFTGIEANGSLIRSVTEETGKKVKLAQGLRCHLSPFAESVHTFFGDDSIHSYIVFFHRYGLRNLHFEGKGYFLNSRS